MSTHSEVIIVGAGMAGIAAGRALHEAGVDVRLLEGRGRLGGRIYTDYSLGAAVDLGAAWIHGPTGNPLTPLAEQYGVSGRQTDFNNRVGEAVLAFDGDGRPLDMAAYTRGGNQYRGAMAHLGATILHPPPPEDSHSLADLYAHGLPGIDLARMSRDERLGYHFTAAIRPQYEEAADLALIDWRLSGQYVHLPGGDLLLHGGGYSQLVAGLAEGLDIRLDTAVTAIEYHDQTIHLQTNNGDYSAAAVIVTVPLGVLQKGSITFTPALAQEKQAAIQRLGMGHYEKIALQFPRLFWPEEPHWFTYLGKEETPFIPAWINMAHYTAQPILVASHAGGRARAINQLSDDDLVTGCLSALQVMFGPAVPEPVAYVRSSWESDPFSNGSYSFSKVGSQAGDRLQLGTAVDGRLFFAGEATHPHYFGTVHAAYESGIRAAQEALQQMRGR